MAGLVLCMGICTFISGNSSMRFYFIKEVVGLRATTTSRIQENFEIVSWDMVTVLLCVRQLFANLME